MKRRIVRHAAVWIALAAWGCSVHRPAVVTPGVTPPPRFLEGSAAGPAPGRWWKALGDPCLDSLMEEALAGNLEIGEALARLARADALFREARAARLPSLDVSGQWSREDTPSFFGNNTGQSYLLSAAARFEVDAWRGLASAARAAALERAAAREDVDTVILGLSARLADAYYLAAAARERLALAGERRRVLSRILEGTEERYRRGLVGADAVQAARRRLAAARAAEAQERQDLALAGHALSVLLGRYPDPGTVREVRRLPSIPRAFPAGLPSELLSRRPDVRAALLRVRAADARVAAALAERFPSFNLLADTGKESLAFSTGDIKGRYWKLLAQAALPLADGGRRRAAADRARAEFDAALAAYRKVVLDAFQEVEDALARNRAAEERLARAEEAASAAGRAWELARSEYRAGVSDFLAQATAREAWLAARSDAVAARRALVTERITLARALGGKWMAAYAEAHAAAAPEEP